MRHRRLLPPLLALISFSGVADAVSPIIGVLSQPSTTNGNHSTFIVASYVKWLEASGARVVPIRFGAPKCEIDFLMQRIGGVLLPGGGAPYALDPTQAYGNFTYSILVAALRRNIPVWGTCQGHEQILAFMAYMGGEPNPVNEFPSEGYTLPLSFTSEAGASSLYSSLSSDVIKSLATGNITINLHKYGVGSVTFLASAALSGRFILVGTSRDIKGNEFVALVQHRSYDLIGTQFHIEKNGFEFQQHYYDAEDGKGDAPPHSEHGIIAAQQLSMWFVGKARKSVWGWDAETLDKWIIYNWPTHFSHKESGTAWEQEYIFPPHPEKPECPPVRDVSETIL